MRQARNISIFLIWSQHIGLPLPLIGLKPFSDIGKMKFLGKVEIEMETLRRNHLGMEHFKRFLRDIEIARSKK